MADYLNRSERPDEDLRRVDREDRVPDEDLRDQDTDDVTPEKSGLRGRLQSARESAQTAREKRANLKEVKRKSQALKRRATLQKLGLSGAAGRISDAVSDAGRNAGDALDDVGTQDSVAQRAERAGQARAPINATLDPMGNPRALESFATGGSVENPDSWVSGGDPDLDDESVSDEPLFAYGGTGSADSREPMGVRPQTDEMDDDQRAPGWFDVSGAKTDTETTDDPLSFDGRGWL